MSDSDQNTPKRSRLSLTSPKSGSTSPQDKNMGYLCPICSELITEAHMTICGHTFCYRCLLEIVKQCAR